MGRARRRVAALAAALSLAACAAIPPGEDDFPGIDPAHDLRADFRAVACSRFPAGISCDAILRREPNEALAPSAPPAGAGAAKRYRVGLVPGLLAECLSPMLRPFGDVDGPLAAKGYDVTYFPVPGRGSAAVNARFLGERLAGDASDTRPWILVAYSKGIVDALELVASGAEGASRIAAIVSISGAAGGSLFADDYHVLYREFVARMPVPACAASDGSEVEGLRRDARAAWWKANGARIRVPVLSLVGAVSADRVSYGSKLAYLKLSSVDPRNDGKILWRDQLVPGGYLLGFVDADHWSIAVPLAKDLPALAFLFRDDVPRAALVESALEVTARLLSR